MATKFLQTIGAASGLKAGLGAESKKKASARGAGFFRVSDWVGRPFSSDSLWHPDNRDTVDSSKPLPTPGTADGDALRECSNRGDPGNGSACRGAPFSHIVVR